MPKYEINGPKGERYEIEAPEGATEQEILSYAQSQFKNQPPKVLTWGEAFSQSGENFVDSAKQFWSDLVYPIMHPIETAKSLGKIGGEIWDAQPTFNVVEGFKNTTGTETPTLDAMGQFFRDRYGGVENIKRTIAKDPVGTLADTSMFLSGGGSAAAKLPGTMGKVGKTVAKIGNAIDPLTGTIKAGKQISKAGGKLSANLIGNLGTHTGAESIKAAYQAGKKGSPDFLKNMRGQESMTAVLDDAKNALINMRNQRSARYKTGMKSTRYDLNKLDFTPIDQKWGELTNSFYEGKHLKIGKDEFNKIKEIENVLDEWRSDPTAHTASGLDALKQRLDAIYPDSPKQNQVQRAVKQMRNAVKNTIVEQVPEYAETMADYEASINVQREIERALSLGDKASADTALRKFQSLTRNNAQTNYGNRLDMAKILEDYGGGNIMEKVSGQAMNEITPRGLAGKFGGAATIGLGYGSHPSYLGLLPFQSPRLVGEATYKLGQGSRLADSLLRRFGISPNNVGNIGRGLYQSGRLTQELTK